MELACELQPSAEQQVQLRRELHAWSKVQAQVEKERKTNASLKRQVEKVEAELEELRQEEEKKKNAPPTRRKKQTYKEEPPENELGLEAMNGVAEAFTEVLLPFLGQLVEIHPSQRTPQEAHVIQWLKNAREAHELGEDSLKKQALTASRSRSGSALTQQARTLNAEKVGANAKVKAKAKTGNTLVPKAKGH